MTSVRDQASVQVKDSVDGSARRKSPSRASKSNARRATTTTIGLDELSPALRAAVLKARRPGESIRIVSPTEVILH